MEEQKPHSDNTDDEQPYWFVMRDLKPVNAKIMAYEMLSDLGFEVFTPMTWKIVVVKGKKVRKEAPIIHNMLFVCSTKKTLDPIVDMTNTLQYQYIRGAGPQNIMKIRDREMRRFIHAANATEKPQYYTTEEITPSMCGKRIKIVGGNLDGYEGFLITTRGSRRKHLLISLTDDGSNYTALSMKVEVSPEYIQVV